ncbi:MAG TPA: hypothetical protein VEC38_08080 [Candidatus Binataceae bacterium]|nr:hypothetical protein [Candidatus Binataceae bacterium]
MIEHKPWEGPNYKDGINGQRIAIVGHSHHGDEDSENFTLEVMADVISGRERYKFFDQIRDYFSFQDSAEFWNHVVFFNYLPDCVGPDEKRYEYGTKEQLDLARERFLRLLKEYRPQKVFVFTTEMWRELPESREQGPSNPSGEIGGDGFSWCTYDADAQIVMAFGLPHPERASKEPTRQAVQRILAMPLLR